MKETLKMSTAKTPRAKRTLPSLPKGTKPSNGVFLSPTCSPRTTRKNCTNSPLSHSTGKDRKDRAKQPSRLPVTIKRSQSLSEIAIDAKPDKLRKQATVDLGGKNSNNNTKDLKYTTPGESNKAKTIKNTTVKNPANSLNKQPNEARVTKKIQEISDPIYHSTSAESSNSRALTKSESMNSLDSLCGLGTEEERSCVTVAVRVRPFNQR